MFHKESAPTQPGGDTFSRPTRSRELQACSQQPFPRLCRRRLPASRLRRPRPSNAKTPASTFPFCCFLLRSPQSLIVYFGDEGCINMLLSSVFKAVSVTAGLGVAPGVLAGRWVSGGKPRLSCEFPQTITRIPNDVIQSLASRKTGRCHWHRPRSHFHRRIWRHHTHFLLPLQTEFLISRAGPTCPRWCPVCAPERTCSG